MRSNGWNGPLRDREGNYWRRAPGSTTEYVHKGKQMTLDQLDQMRGPLMYRSQRGWKRFTVEPPERKRDAPSASDS